MREIATFGFLARELGVKKIQFNPLRNEPEAPNPEQLEEIKRLVEKAEIDFPDVKVLGRIFPQIKVETPCWISPLRVVISAEGDVHLCNYFNHRRETHTFGNIHRHPLKEIWLCQVHLDALAGIKPEECRLYDCRFHRLNSELLDLVENHREQLDFA